MAEIRQPSLEELIRALSIPGANVDTNLIGDRAIKGMELQDTILKNKQAQEDRTRKIQQEIATLKQAKDQKAKEQRFASTLKGPVVANIGGQEVRASETQALAPQHTLAPLAEAFPKETAEAQLKILTENAKPAKEKDAANLQRVGVLRSGQAVSYSPDLGQNVIVTAKGREVYNPTKHGQILPERAPQLPAEQINQVANSVTARRQLAGVRASFSPTFVGPVEARFRDFERTFGIDLGQLKNAKGQQFQTELANAINNYIKATTGAQMSEPEARRIQRALPSQYRADEAFIAQLDAALRETDNVLSDRLAIYESLGFGRIPDLKESIGSPSTPSSGDLQSRAKAILEQRRKSKGGK